MDTKEFTSSNYSLTKWSGIQDFLDGYQAYQKKDYPSLKKCLAIGLLKIGTIGAACYGAYHWVFSKPVFLNDVLHKAEQEVQNNPQSTTVPESTKKLVESLYHEQPNYRHWPQSGKDFVANNLNSNTAASAAVVTHLVAQANQRDDSSLIRAIKKTCSSAAGHMTSCLAALKSFVGSSTKETLDDAMSITRQCKKSENSYCVQASEEAKRQSMALESIDDVLTLVQKIARAPVVSGKDIAFVEKAVDLFTKRLAEKEEIAAVCEKALKDESAVKDCYQHANVVETLQYLDAGFDWRMERYRRGRAERSRKELKEALTSYGTSLAEACLKVKDSPKCQAFANDIIQKLLENDLADEGFRLITKASPGALSETFFVDIMTKLTNEGNWEKATRMSVSLLKNNPSPTMQDAIGEYWDQLLASEDHSHLALALLKDGVALYEKEPSRLKKTVERALSNPSDRATIDKLYEAAKTWITSSGIKNQEQLLHIIRTLMAGRESEYYYQTPNQREAAVLVTKLILMEKPENVNQLSMYGSDFYDFTIRDKNWEERLRDAGYEV